MTQAIATEVIVSTSQETGISLFSRRWRHNTIDKTATLEESSVELIPIVCHQQISLFHNLCRRLNKTSVVEGILLKPLEVCEGKGIGIWRPQPFIAEDSYSTKIGLQGIHPDGFEVPDEYLHLMRRNVRHVPPSGSSSSTSTSTP